MIQPIARKIGAEVAEGLAKKVAPTAKKAVKAVADKADDWGWKGGKPGELTGSKFVKSFEKLKDPDKRDELLDRAADQLDRAAEAGKYQKDWSDTIETMYDFARLEKLGIPRRLTGKLMHTFGGTLDSVGSDASILAAAQRINKMDPGQIATLRTLANGWTGTVDELLNAAELL